MHAYAPDNIVVEMKALLDLFADKVPDRESNRLLRQLCDDQAMWAGDHGLHAKLRDKNLKAIKQGDRARERQYLLEEAIAKTLYNLTLPTARFDPDAPYRVIKDALLLAKALSVPVEEVVNVVAPDQGR